MTRSVRLVRAFVCVVGILVPAVALVGCAAVQPARPCAANPGPGLVIAVGGRANSDAPTLSAEVMSEIENMITAAGDDGAGAVTLVRVDGEPAYACTVSFNLADVKNDDAKANERQTFRTNVPRQVAAVRAVTDEADVLKALQLASDAAGPNGTVVLVDSGLQTVNPLNFTVSGLMDADANYLADLVARGGFLHGLSGQKVILAGIGNTVPPQTPLDEPRRQHLRDIWEAIVRKAGATDVVVVTAGGNQKAVDGLPNVSVVPVPEVGPFTPDCNVQIILPDNGEVGFLPNRAVFREPGRAREVLVPLAAWLRDTAQGHVRLTGSIAHYGDRHDTSLSLARANAVRDLLVELGADGSRITTTGIGWGPIPSPDAAPDSVSDPLNRRVVADLKCT